MVSLCPYIFIVQSGEMKEFLYSRNAVYETLRAKRREVFKIGLDEATVTSHIFPERE